MGKVIDLKFIGVDKVKGLPTKYTKDTKKTSNDTNDTKEKSVKYVKSVGINKKPDAI